MWTFEQPFTLDTKTLNLQFSIITQHQHAADRQNPTPLGTVKDLGIWEAVFNRKNLLQLVNPGKLSIIVEYQSLGFSSQQKKTTGKNGTFLLRRRWHFLIGYWM